MHVRDSGDGGDIDTKRGRNLKNLHPNISPFYAPLSLFVNLKNNWYLLSNMVKRNLNQRYDKALLGYIWTLLEPALLAAVYYILFIIIADYKDSSYPMLILLGVIGWSLFVKVLNGTVASLYNNSGMIKQSGFPLEIYPAADCLTNLAISTISIFTVIPFMIQLNIHPSTTLWMLPVALIMLVLTALGIGLMFSSINIIFPDITHAFRFITRAGFFVSPIMWTYEILISRVGENSPYIDIVMLNPVVVPLTMMRHSIQGTIPNIDIGYVIYAALFPIICYIVGSIVFVKTSRRVVKRL